MRSLVLSAAFLAALLPGQELVAAKKKTPAAAATPSAPAPAAEQTPAPTLTPPVIPQELAAGDPKINELLVEGAKLLEAGAIDGARLKFQKVLEAEPQNVVALSNLGSVEYRARNLVKAEEHLRRATRISPGNVSAWLTLGVVAHDANKLDLAIAALAQAVFLDPSNSTAHTYFGVTMGRKGWLDAAESELLRALSLDNTSRDAHFNFAVICLQKSPPSVAIARRHYQRALQLGAKPDPVIEKHLGQPVKSVE